MSKCVTLTEDDIEVLLTALKCLYASAASMLDRDRLLMSAQRYVQLQKLLRGEA